MSDNEMTAVRVIVDLCSSSETDISGWDSEDISESLLVKDFMMKVYIAMEHVVLMFYILIFPYTN